MDSISTKTISMGEAQRQWFARPKDERYETLDAIQAAVDARSKASYEETLVGTEVRVEVLKTRTADEEIENIRIVSSKTGPMSPTHWAFGQFCARAGAPAGYLRKLPAANIASDLNYGLSKLGTTEEAATMKLLTLDRDGDFGEAYSEMRASTSPSYGRIFDSTVVAATRSVVELTSVNGKPTFFNPKEWGGRPSGLYASDHDVFMFLIDGGSIVDGGSERDQLHRGFFVWNSEVGARTLGIQTFLFRGCCGNHMIWGPENVKALQLRHSLRAPERFVEEVTPRLKEYTMQGVQSYQDAIFKAKEYRIASDTNEAEKWLREKGFTNSEARRAVAAADREEGAHDSLWLIVQGLTATARDMAFIDARVDLETRAGKLLDLAA